MAHIWRLFGFCKFVLIKIFLTPIRTVKNSLIFSRNPARGQGTNRPLSSWHDMGEFETK
jgi:hypothetical protein